MMFGIAGRDNGERNAAATAELLNEFPPLSVTAMPLIVEKGSELWRRRATGTFHEADTEEIIAEEKVLIARIEVPTRFFGVHSYRLFSVQGRLPCDREKMLAGRSP